MIRLEEGLAASDRAVAVGVKAASGADVEMPGRISASRGITKRPSPGVQVKIPAWLGHVLTVNPLEHFAEFQRARPMPRHILLDQHLQKIPTAKVGNVAECSAEPSRIHQSVPQDPQDPRDGSSALKEFYAFQSLLQQSNNSQQRGLSSDQRDAELASRRKAQQFIAQLRRPNGEEGEPAHLFEVQPVYTPTFKTICSKCVKPARTFQRCRFKLKHTGPDWEEADEEALLPLQDGEEAVQEELVKCAPCKLAHRTQYQCRVKLRHTAPSWNASVMPPTPPVVSAAPEPGKHVPICAPLPQDGTEVACPNCGRAFRSAQGLGSHLLTCRSATEQPAAETLDPEPSSPPPHQQQADDEAGWRQDAETAFGSTCWDCKVSRKSKKFCRLVRLHTDPDWQVDDRRRAQHPDNVSKSDVWSPEAMAFCKKNSPAATILSQTSR